MIELYQLYPSGKRVMHRVKSIQQVGQMLHISLDCGIRLIVKDSSRGRAARWIDQMIYWAECKNCYFPEKPSKKYAPREKLKVAPEKKLSRRGLHLGNFEVKRRG